MSDTAKTDTNELRQIAAGLDAYERTVSDTLRYGDILRSAADEIDAARKVLDALPRTADGVPIVPGMTVWHNGLHDGFTGPHEFRVCHEGVSVEQFTASPKSFYSTRDAALAAKGEK